MEENNCIDQFNHEWTYHQLEERNVILTIVNVLGSGCLRTAIDIVALSQMVRNADFSSKRFGGLHLRFREPQASITVYRSGKFLVMGLKNPDLAQFALHKFQNILQKLDFPSDILSFNIANIVASTDLKFRVRLEGLASDHIRFCSYEPELFPGLVYRIIEPKCTLLVFTSGKIVVLGYKSIEEGQIVLARLYPIFLQYKIVPNCSSESSTERQDD